MGHFLPRIHPHHFHYPGGFLDEFYAESNDSGRDSRNDPAFFWAFCLVPVSGAPEFEPGRERGTLEIDNNNAWKLKK